MSDIVIVAENLGKKYVIGHQAENGPYLALRDVLMQNARGLWRKTRDLVQGRAIILGDTLEEVWALKEVSFEVRRGEAVGIIGRNGAGKSTLLKILSRITEPSAGRVTIKGRVASLLEVGTGFHPELTGRENVYLNGAILGMTRAEIKRKFDEIVAFAEVEKFLDTPVKRYSSGMYVRLAFSVAAHLEPEILLVDEVLAVGDLPFQKKCLGKMGEVAGQGRTVLFVSHNMAAVQRLCTRAMLVSQGEIVEQGDVKTVTEHYLGEGRTAVSGVYDLRNLPLPSWQRRIRGDLRFNRCVMLNAKREPSATLQFGEPITVHLEVVSTTSYDDLDLGFWIDSVNEIRITTIRNTDPGVPVSIAAGNPLRINVLLEDFMLLPGSYSLSVFAHSGKFASDVILRVINFEIDEVAYGEHVLAMRQDGLVGARAIWDLTSRAYGL